MIERYSLDPNVYDSLDAEYWSSLEDKMSKRLTIEHEKPIEDCEDSVIIDFANSFIGGGTLNRGMAQEEILFQIFP